MVDAAAVADLAIRVYEDQMVQHNINFCKNGHSRVPENITFQNRCRLCWNEYKRRRNLKNRQLLSEPSPKAEPLNVEELKSRATINVDEAAELLGISRHRAYEAIREGRIPVLKLGTRRFVVPVGTFVRMLGFTDANEDEATVNELREWCSMALNKPESNDFDKGYGQAAMEIADLLAANKGKKP